MTMRNNPLHPACRGMTLVELLVVVTILGILLVVSVPLLKPMLDTRRTSNAAQVLAGTFQQVRMKSMQEGKNFGLRLLPYESAKTVSVQLRQQRIVPDVVNPLESRAVVKNGMIALLQYNETSGWQPHPESEVLAKQYLQPGYKIQFNGIGRFFTIGANYNLESPYETLNLPNDVTSTEVLSYRITGMPPVSSWIPQTVMPRSAVVDLVFSGGETFGFDDAYKTEDDITAGAIPPSFENATDVIVLFSSAGHVDSLFVDGVPKKVNELLYFCVGEWDRQVDASGKTLAEDGKSNLETPATYWVTLHPKTGEVRITENAPVKEPTDKNKRLDEARRFAKEHFVNVGGF